MDEKAQPELLSLSRWYRQISAAAWRKELAEGLTEEEVARIRLRTHTGRPLGSDSFVSKLETLLGRRVRPPQAVTECRPYPWGLCAVWCCA